MFILSKIVTYKKWNLSYGIDFFNHLNKGGVLQPSQPNLFSGYGDFQRKIKGHGTQVWLLRTSPLAKYLQYKEKKEEVRSEEEGHH